MIETKEPIRGPETDDIRGENDELLKVFRNWEEDADIENAPLPTY